MSQTQRLVEGTRNLPKDSEQRINSMVHLHHLSMRILAGGSNFEQDQEHVTSAREI